MSRATSYTLNDRMELAGPEEDKQITEAKRWLKRIKVQEMRDIRKPQPGPADSGSERK